MTSATASSAVDLTRFFGPSGRDLLSRCLAALRGDLPVEEVWLFGSCARGDAKPDSDLDLLVVLADGHGLARPTLACYRAIRRLHTGIPTDVLAISRSRWEREQAEPFGLLGEVGREGVKLYAKTEYIANRYPGFDDQPPDLTELREFVKATRKLFEILSARKYAGPELAS